MFRDENNVIAKTKKDRLLVAVWGFYEELLWNNFLFHNENAPIGDNLLKPLNSLYRQGKKRNIDFVTLDTVDHLEDVDLYIFLDVPRNDSPISKRVFEDSHTQKWLLICESLIVKPDSLDPGTVSRFDKIFTYLDSIIDNKKFFSLRYAFDLPCNIVAPLSARTRLCAMIAGAKSNNHALSLYNERLKAIRWFEQHHPEGFNLYGLGWNPLEFPSHKGAVRSKSDVLQHYKFSICYENARDIPGYITEKIFDCFFAGCIPIYRGADNICDHVPKECFIDLRDFSSYESLYSYISAMPEDIYNAYINNIRLYLRSSKSFPYSITNYCNTIIEHCLSLVPQYALKTKAYADNQVKISICIPTYNRVAYLKEAIESALLQSYSNIEVIVSDNASTDGTFELCKQYESDSRFRYYRNPSNIGGICNIEKCVYGLATGDYGLILSDDDYLYDPDYVSKAAQLIHEHGESVLLVFANYARYSEESECITEISDFNLKPVIKGFELFYKWWLPLEGYPVWVPLLTAVFNRKKALELNAFRTPDIMASDTMLWWKLCLSGDVGFVNSPAAVYRVHGNSDSTTADFSRYSNNIRMFIIPARFALDHGYDLQTIRKWKWRMAQYFILNAVGIDSVREKFAESGVIEKLTSLYQKALEENLSREEEERREDLIIEETIRFMGGAPYLPIAQAERVSESVLDSQAHSLSILFVVHNFPPHWFAGVENYTYQLAQHLKQVGCDMSVLYPFHNQATEQPYISEEVYNGLRVYKLVSNHSSSNHAGLTAQISNSQEEPVFGELLSRERFDVIHFHHTINLSFSYPLIAQKIGLPVCVTLHDYWPLCLSIHFYDSAANRLCDGPISASVCADCYLRRTGAVVSGEYRQAIEQWVDFRKEYALRMLNGINLLSSPSDYLATAYRKYGVTRKIEIAPLGIIPVENKRHSVSTPVVFGFLGVVHNLKNVFMLAEAFMEVRGEARLTFWGNGVDYCVDRLKAIISNDNRIEYRGQYTPEQLPEILGDVDIVVVPSLIESYSLVVREALSAGVPVIASRVGGIPEIVTHNVNGVLFDPTDKEELKSYLQSFVDNPKRITELAAGIGTIKTMAQDAQEWKDRYQSLLRAMVEKPAAQLQKRRTIAVFTLDNREYACPQLRLVGPLSHVHDEYELRWGAQVANNKCTTDMDAIKAADIIIVQRFYPRIGTLQYLEQMFASGKPVIYELDDLITSVPDDNHLKLWIKETADLLPALLPRFSAVTVSTAALVDAFKGYNPNIHLIPNLIDESVWQAVPKIESDGPVVIGFAGTATHRGDLLALEPVLFKLAEKYGNKLAFRFMGFHTPACNKLPGFSFIPFAESYRSYVAQLPLAGFDIAIIPLQDNPFNRAKSNIKWLEYSAYGVAGVYADLAPYNSCIKHGETGLLVGSDPEQWFQAVSLLVENPELRRKIAEHARREVLAKYTLQQGAHRWLEVYQEILEKHAGQDQGHSAASTCLGIAGDMLVDSAKQAPKVSIIIPVFNQLHFTQQCLKALFSTLPATISCEIIVVDNASTDGTGAYLRSLGNRARVVSNAENQGFAKACNQGAQAANGKYLLFLNNDTEPQPGWLEPLLNSAEHDATVAATGGKLLFPDGTIQHAGILISDDRMMSDPLVATHICYGFPADHPAANISRGWQALTAACLLVRREAFETVQGFDEGYWNGYEDVDLCFKLGQKGWKLIYQPASVVVHHESKSGSERFAKAAQNIQRLHQKWLGIIRPDVIIHPGSRVEWLGSGVSAAPPARPLVSIIIPLFNQAELTKSCIEAIRATAGDPGRYELILVDNGSSDWTAEYLKSLGTAVAAITNRENLGFAKACNQGAQTANGEYLLFLNNDTVPQAGWLNALLSGVREDGGDIVGAKLLYPNGRIQHAGVAFNRNGIGYHIFKNFAADAPAVSTKRFMQCVTGACLLVSRHLFSALRGFDDQFRNGFEDVDFCLRAGQAGKRVLYTPDAVILHHEERSVGRKQHDRENMQLYLNRWQGRVRCDDEEFYAAEGFSFEWHADGTCVVRPRSTPEVANENNRYPLVPLVGSYADTPLARLSASTRMKAVLKKYTTNSGAAADLPVL